MFRLSLLSFQHGRADSGHLARRYPGTDLTCPADGNGRGWDRHSAGRRSGGLSDTAVPSEPTGTCHPKDICPQTETDRYTDTDSGSDTQILMNAARPTHWNIFRASLLRLLKVLNVFWILLFDAMRCDSIRFIRLVRFVSVRWVVCSAAVCTRYAYIFLAAIKIFHRHSNAFAC